MQLTDTNWNDVLINYIPIFKGVNNRNLCIYVTRKLVHQTCDRHNQLSIFYTLKRNSLKWLARTCLIIDNKIIVGGMYNENFGKLSKLRMGDEILKINGVLISEHIAFYNELLSGSNQEAKNNNISDFLFSGYSDSSVFAVLRNDTILTFVEKCFLEKELIKSSFNYEI